MDFPIPFALSRVVTVASNAIETKITDNKHPVITRIKPVDVGSYINTGIPQPIRNDRQSENASPVKRLSQMYFLFRG